MTNKKNVLIRSDFNIYNTKSLFNEGTMVKVPSWVIQDAIENNKNILIKLNQVNIANYSTKELKNNLITVESKVYKGRFKHQDINYNLCQIKIDLTSSKEKNIKNTTSSNQVYLTKTYK